MEIQDKESFVEYLKNCKTIPEVISRISKLGTTINKNDCNLFRADSDKNNLRLWGAFDSEKLNERFYDFDNVCELGLHLYYISIPLDKIGFDIVNSKLSDITKLLAGINTASISVDKDLTSFIDNDKNYTHVGGEIGKITERHQNELVNLRNKHEQELRDLNQIQNGMYTNRESSLKDIHGLLTLEEEFNSINGELEVVGITCSYYQVFGHDTRLTAKIKDQL